eukprot:00550_2
MSCCITRVWPWSSPSGMGGGVLRWYLLPPGRGGYMGSGRWSLRYVSASSTVWIRDGFVSVLREWNTPPIFTARSHQDRRSINQLSSFLRIRRRRQTWRLRRW